MDEGLVALLDAVARVVRLHQLPHLVELRPLIVPVVALVEARPPHPILEFSLPYLVCDERLDGPPALEPWVLARLGGR